MRSPNTTEISPYTLVVTAVSIVLVLAAGIGLRSPWPADEPRFVLIAQEMLLGGDWLFPHRAAELYSHKPPLFAWVLAGAMALTGSMRIGFLLPSLLAAVATLLMVFDLARRLWGGHAALLATLLLATTPQFSLQAKTAQIDMLLCCWLTLGLYGLFRHLLLGPAWGWYGVAFVAMGLGVLTKIVGFLPLFMALPFWWLLWRHPGQVSLHRLWPALALTLLLPLTAALWLGPMLWQVWSSGDPQLQAYAHDLLVGQTISRYDGELGHNKPWFYYLTSVIPLFWLPLSLLLPFLARPWWQALKRGDGAHWLLLGYALLVLLFYSCTPSKRGVYILAMLPALCLCAAPHLQALRQRRLIQRLLWGLSLLLAVALLAAAASGGRFANVRDLAEMPELLTALRWTLASIGSLTLIAVLWLRPGRGDCSWLVTAALLWLGYSVAGYPLLEPLRSPVHSMQEVASHLGPDDELAIINYREQQLLFADRPVTHFGFFTDKQQQDEEAAQWLRESPATRWVMLPASKSGNCFDEQKAIDLGQEQRWRWLLVNADAIRPECPADGGLPRFQAPWYGNSRSHH